MTPLSILETPMSVYNFEVEDFHTYYVSELGLLVHNRCDNLKPGGSKGTTRNNQAQNEQTRSLSRKYNLDKNQQRQLHDDITDQNWGYKEIEQQIIDWIIKKK